MKFRGVRLKLRKTYRKTQLPRRNMLEEARLYVSNKSYIV
jgi:hypothetical protein